jgi:hypothetical protein
MKRVCCLALILALQLAPFAAMPAEVVPMADGRFAIVLSAEDAQNAREEGGLVVTTSKEIDAAIAAAKASCGLRS